MSRHTASPVAPVLDFVAARTGLNVPPEQQVYAAASIQRVMERARVSEVEAYLRLLERSGPALDALLTELTVGETYFFREPKQWEFVRDVAIPQLLRHRGREHPIAAWSAACATGEEPYTMAMVLREIGRLPGSVILGTDLSRDRLERARRGAYSAWSLRGVSSLVQSTYFTRGRDRFRLIPEIRAAVSFREHNLASADTPSPPGGGGWDLVFCRNVLIYLDREVVAGVARRLIDALSPAGWLLLGAADPPLAGLVPCEVVRTGAGVAYRRPRARASRPSAPAAGATAARPGPSAPPRGRAARAVRTPLPPAPPAPQPSAPPAGDLLAEAQLLYAGRDYEAAARRAGELTGRAPAEAGAWLLRVRALANLGRLPEAGEACATALEHHPANAELLYLQALLQVQAGRADAAAHLLRQALYLEPDLAVAHLLAGLVATQRGDADAARRALQAAERLLLALQPDAPVHGGDGETAASLLTTTRAQIQRLDSRRSA